MNKDYVKITIEQISDKEFDCHISGNFEDLLKCLAVLVSQVVASAPQSHQQTCRAKFLDYLNQATIEEHRKEM